MKCVILETPFAGDIERNKRYLRACMKDCIHKGEAPYASHGLYTQPGVLDDKLPSERALGIAAGFAWRCKADYTVVYTDLGISGGMAFGIADAIQRNLSVAYRTLGANWDNGTFSDVSV